MSDVIPDHQLIEVAKASPAAVARHDREAWVGLFSSHAVIEDPVGSRPHHSGLHDPGCGVRGAGSLERFYDTFIAPNQITFHVDQDVIAAPFVVRDLTIELVMAAGLTIRVPMHLLYEITQEDGVPKISHLRAHWELLPMIRQVLGKGWPGLMILNRLGVRMIGNQGLGSVIGFAKGLFGIHGAGKEAVRRLVEAVNQKDGAALASLFDRRNAGISLPAGKRALPVESFCHQADVFLSITKLISSGYLTSCTFSARSGESQLRGVGFFEFNSRSRKLHAARFYCA